MAQNENFQSINQWVANCNDNHGGLDRIKDLDYRIFWGSNGTITINRHNLIEIRYTLKGWNSKDGWKTKTRKQTLPAPVERHTFNHVTHALAFGKIDTLSYFGKKYKIKGILEIFYGDPPGEIGEVYSTTVQGCLKRNDPNYYNYFGCTPPNTACGEE